MTKPENDKHLVHDYEFFMPNGVRQLFTVDETQGDTFSVDAEKVTIDLVPKPSRTNPDFKSPAEDYQIFLAPGMIIAHKTRMVPNNPALKVPAFNQMDPPQTIPESR